MGFGTTDANRIFGIDVYKGILMILVIKGHLFTVYVYEDPIKWLIYGFHMPAFVALSGYLLNTNSLHTSTYVDVLKRYGRSLVFPWLIATLVYWWATSYEPNSVSELVTALVFKPKFHLWYIPALLLWIILTRFLIKWKVSLRNHFFQP